MFSYPPLLSSDPPCDNWYQDLLDDPGCHNNPTKVQEAYWSHRQSRHKQMVQGLQSYANSNADKTYAKVTLLNDGRLHEKGIDPLHSEAQAVNCFALWARPTVKVNTAIDIVIRRVQSVLGQALFPVPVSHRHLSVIEFSHRHEQSVLEDVKLALEAVLPQMLKLPQPISLSRPMVTFDSAGLALSFIPGPTASYHHLRNDLQKKALAQKISIDTCYTAATAHIAIARFVADPFDHGKAETFLELVEEINEEFKDLVWDIAEHGLELQMGYLKFGRERELASMVGSNNA